MVSALTLTCPIRGTLKASARSKDGLKPSEEYFRVEAIRHLLKLGYPKDNFKIEAAVKRFGNAGRNSMRADFAILDVPANSIPKGDVDALLEHAVLLCEVKRENAAPEYVKKTQVQPLLDFAKSDDCLALYWDNVDQRVFWHERAGGKKVTKEGPLALVPKCGARIKLKPLTFSDTSASDSLLDLFERIDDLHTASVDLEQRYSVMLQLLLAKLFDEHGHQAKPSASLEVQDYAALGHNEKSALAQFHGVLEKAVSYYQRHLPKPIDNKLPGKVTGKVLCEICKLLAPVRLIASKRDVIQAFYMKFAKGLYKWDLAQYFTPPTVTDFIVNVLNPQFAEHIKDPACGSADFLTAAFHLGRDKGPNYADCIWGTDNSKSAVQVAVLNMLLNGDGKSNVKEADSLATVDSELNQYEIMVCNPPFGVRISEKDPQTLRKFDLGHEWIWDAKLKTFVKQKQLLDGQETGLLFTEVCVLQAKPGVGRIGIILPNGYLANRSKKYKIFREWILKHCRIVAICSFPRFTFKTSGADVSASIVYLEKRKKPLKKLNQDSQYCFSVQMIENVGWNLGDKKAAPRYQRNEEDGSYIVGTEGQRLLDADFQGALEDLRSSSAATYFPWLRKGKPKGNGKGWTVDISAVLSDPDLTLDPKRHCRKFSALRKKIGLSKHLLLGDIVDFYAEGKTTTGKVVRKVDRDLYRYAEIQDIGYGDMSTTDLRGWELPQRAKHFAEAGDIYVGKIWGSVSKWCLAPNDSKNIVLTNGCHRMRLKKGKEKYLPDLVAFICTEAYAVQMRALARGSDGLAEVTEDDTSGVLVPELNDAVRNALEPYISSLKSGVPDLKSKVTVMLGSGELGYPKEKKRPSHVVLV